MQTLLNILVIGQHVVHHRTYVRTHAYKRQLKGTKDDDDDDDDRNFEDQDVKRRATAITLQAAQQMKQQFLAGLYQQTFVVLGVVAAAVFKSATF